MSSSCSRYADASRWKVQLGKLSAANSIDASYGEYESSVTQIHVHGDYNSQTSDNDIAILVLSDPVPDSTGDFVNIACLDTHSRKVFNETSNCFITGFGATQCKFLLFVGLEFLAIILFLIN